MPSLIYEMTQVPLTRNRAGLAQNASAFLPEWRK